MTMPLWKIDEAVKLPLAIIEDTEDGIGVLELSELGRGEPTPDNIAFAQQIVEAHNRTILDFTKEMD